MAWEHDAELSDGEVAELWAASGAQWLTDLNVAVPGSLVRRVVGLVARLGQRGAALAEVLGARGLGGLAERAAVMGLAPSGRVSAGGATGLLRAADGWLALSLARPEDLGALPAWLDGATTPAPGTPPADVWTDLAPMVGRRSAVELVERASLLGLPCSVVGEVTDPRPVLVERLGDASPRPMDGALVVSLASLWAGPLCADVLARLGARVVTVESTGRPDGGRLAGRFFEALHGRSESVALDLAGRDGQETLADLLRCADVVIEGSRPRALEQMGIEARQVVAEGPQVWLSITAHGRGPAARERVGFGDDAAAAGGLVGWIDGQPRFLGDAIGDPLGGLTAAYAVAAHLEAGGRWLVDVALARATAAATGGWLPRADVEPSRPHPRRDPGGQMPLGRDTDAVLGDLIGRSGSRDGSSSGS